MINNPELRRNLWLSFSPARLIIMPLLILLLSGLMWYQFQQKGCLQPANQIFILSTLKWMFFFIMFFWGFTSAGNSIALEMQEGTWDQQRMSALSPWTMTWGKLLGSTAYAWYGGFFCLALFTAFSLSDNRSSVSLIAIEVLTWIVLALWTSAMALLVSFTGIKGRHGASYAILGGFLILFPFLSFQNELSRLGAVQWWSFSVEVELFILLSISFFAICTIFSVWRSMCSALQLGTLPWALPLFLILLALYTTGFFQEEKALPLFLFFLGVFAYLSTYAILTLHKPRELIEITWKRLAHHKREGQWRKFFQTLPLWPITLLLILLSIALTLIFAPGIPFGIKNLVPNWTNVSRELLLGLALLALLRDICVYLFIFFSRDIGKKANLTFMVYLFIIYFILPFFTFRTPMLQAILQPLSLSASLTTTLAAGLGQLVIGLGLVLWKIQKLNKQRQ